MNDDIEAIRNAIKPGWPDDVEAEAALDRLEELIAAAREVDDAAGLTGSGVKITAALRTLHAALKRIEEEVIAEDISPR